MGPKKVKASKLRKVWVIKPVTKVKGSKRKDLLERARIKEAKNY